MSTELTAPESKETKLAVILKGLNSRELTAYRYFLNAKQPSVSEEKAEEMFRLYKRGVSCEEIRRLFAVFGLGQVVACRVAFEWDSRVSCDRENQKKDVVERTSSTQLEMQEFLSTLMAASHRRFMDAMQMYVATGDVKYMEGIPFPKNMRDIQGLIDAYMKIAGLDQKKVDVTLHGSVSTAPVAQPLVLKQEEAEAAVDKMLGDVIDADFTTSPPPGALPPVADPPAPVTRERMIENFMAQGNTYEQALTRLEKLEDDIHVLAEKYADEAAADDGDPKKDDEVN